MTDRVSDERKAELRNERAPCMEITNGEVLALLNENDNLQEQLCGLRRLHDAALGQMRSLDRENRKLEAALQKILYDPDCDHQEVAEEALVHRSEPDDYRCAECGFKASRHPVDIDEPGADTQMFCAEPQRPDSEPAEGERCPVCEKGKLTRIECCVCDTCDANPVLSDQIRRNDERFGTAPPQRRDAPEEGGPDNLTDETPCSGAWEEPMSELRRCSPEIERELHDKEDRIRELETALRFYADGEHFMVSLDRWEDFSGKPYNVLFNTSIDDTEYIENGHIAREALATPPPDSEPNQCDGCRRGLPLDEGVHYHHEGDEPYMVCTADQYDSEPACALCGGRGIVCGPSGDGRDDYACPDCSKPAVCPASGELSRMHGHGDSEPAEGEEKCLVCDGTGNLYGRQPEGMYGYTPCHNCKGTGKPPVREPAERQDAMLERRDALDDDTILRLLREHKVEGQTFKRWKDSIDIDVPTLNIERFANAIYRQALSAGVPEDRESALWLMAQIIERFTEKPPGPADPPFEFQPEWIRKVYYRQAERALAQSEQGRVPEGWKLVPVEPTGAMWEAADDVLDRSGAGIHRVIIPVWEAMLAAAPQPQEDE